MAEDFCDEGLSHCEFVKYFDEAEHIDDQGYMLTELERLRCDELVLLCKQ
ncbi:hypothetical protein [Lentilitoribacter sp. EG35]